MQMSHRNNHEREKAPRVYNSKIVQYLNYCNLSDYNNLSNVQFIVQIIVVIENSVFTVS